MRIKQGADNGNAPTYNNIEVSHENLDSKCIRVSETNTNNLNLNRTDNAQFNTNYNSIYDKRERLDELVNNTDYFKVTRISNYEENSPNGGSEVCNKQYRINKRNNVTLVTTKKDSEAFNLGGISEILIASYESFSDSNLLSNGTPFDDERAFEQPDLDEMSEISVHPVPRGIVNPNYPGFQHLAHTLQDYSSNIENFYHSENEMTDDDLDVEITDLTYETESYQNGASDVFKNINNNNLRSEEPILKELHSNIDLYPEINLDQVQNDIPDLLKNVSKKNNNIDSYIYDINSSDIENNFNTKDIIGDFNKEVEDEIKQLLNYNINIEDDLKELRKDIKESFAIPIENTINNINEVVNHVIKKLVETHSDTLEKYDENSFLESCRKHRLSDEVIEINRENAKKSGSEMNLNRPTFLLIENNTNGRITDAFLSDGKDEINISEYDPEKLSQNVEYTIKQLSTELRKIIPKLDEMKERDRLWAECNKASTSVLKDGNSNEIGNSSNNCNYSKRSIDDNSRIGLCRNKEFESHTSVNKLQVKSPIEPLEMKDRRKESRNCNHNAQNTASVRNDSAKDFDLDSFDVYNIETALPKLDLDAIENHLKAAKEAERRVRDSLMMLEQTLHRQVSTAENK